MKSSIENFLTAQEEKQVVLAIQEAETMTSGEIRVHIELSPDKPLMQKAQEIFYKLGMDKTKQKNGILFYVAVKSRAFVILGDEGIDKKVPSDFWQEETSYVISKFKQGDYAQGLIGGIIMAGEKLKEFFPCQIDDTDELSNELSKG